MSHDLQLLLHCAALLFACTYIIGIFACVALYNKFYYGKSSLFGIDLLFVDERKFLRPLPAGYQKRIDAALAKFRSWPSVTTPSFFYLPGARGPRCRYFTPNQQPSHAIVLAESWLNETLDQLAAVIAHELAHAEWVCAKKEGGHKDTRPHWQVDVACRRAHAQRSRSRDACNVQEERRELL